MKTLSYVYGTEEEFEIGTELYFGQLWDGDGDGAELLESGAIGYYDRETEEEYVIDFDIVEVDEEPLKALVRVTGIC